MKRLLLQLLLITSLFGFAGPIDKATALKVANTFRDSNKAYKNSFQADRNTTSLIDITEKTSFQNFYIFSDEHSFVIVSADDCVKPILAYSMDNPFKNDVMPENIASWLQGYEEQIILAKTRSASPPIEVKQAWEQLKSGEISSTNRAIAVVGPLIQTQWDQTNPYNSLCPTGTYTGCVATAMAQIMKFWNYPEHGVGTHSYVHSTYGTLTADFGATTYRWSDMANTYSSSSSAAAKEAVATLMYHCGVSVDMDYNTSSSSATTLSAAYALKNYFNYNDDVFYANRSNYDDDEWVTMMIEELDAGRPMEYHGSSSEGGHSFVCDGYDTNGNFHFNWGWGGYCDGYYTIDHLEPGTGGVGAGAGIYNTNQGAIFKIEPSISPVDAPLNLSATYDNEGTAELTWSASSGAMSYNVYRNSLMIASGITTTTFTDSLVPYGTIKYYVRAVDSDGFLSLASNYAIVVRNYKTPIVGDLAGTASGRDVTLTWSAPEWCYPEEESAILTYGEGLLSGTLGFSTYNMNMYWGHRYPVSDLSDYDKMSIYKVSFYANSTGSYKLYIYEDSQTSTFNNSDCPKTLTYEQIISINEEGWNDIILTTPYIIDSSKDVWIFMYDPEIRDYPSTYGTYSGSDEGNYYSYYSSSYPYSPQHFALHYSGTAFLIKTYVTDGIYTYNIYRNDEKIASEQDGYSYTDTNLADGHYEYYLTTNYYKGESDASNIVEFDISVPVVEIDVIAAPQPICSGETLTLAVPEVTGETTEAGWQIADGNDFSSSTTQTIPYTGQTLDDSYDGWWMRYWVLNDQLGYVYSNSVQISVKSVYEKEFSHTACESYEWNGQTYTESQTLTYSGIAANGCDSIVTLELTVNHPQNITLEPVTTCGSYDWNGQTYTDSQTLTYSGIGANGCDSIVTLELTVNHPQYITLEPVNACGSFEWNGQTYTDSQTLTYSGIGANGCDSIVTLELTVNNPQYITLEPVTTCGNFEWNGQTYTESQTLTYSGIGANGCDSIVTLELTVNPTYEVSDLYSACHDELPFSWNGVLFTEAGTQSAQLETSNGCDSIVTMTLEVWNPQISMTGNLEIVQGESTTLTAHGCDFYHWSTGETTPSITVAPNETTTYSVTGTIFNGCATYAEATVHVTEGINEKESLVNVYPNPVKNTLYVDAEDIISVRLVNKTGQIIHESKQSGSHMQIDMTPYASGHYFLQITTSDGIMTCKVLKEQ